MPSFKIHIKRKGEENVTLCSMVLHEPLFSNKLEEVTCKKCLRIHKVGNYKREGDSAHQADLRRRMALNDKSVHKCKCGKLYASVLKFEGDPAAPNKCIVCRREEE